MNEKILNILNQARKFRNQGEYNQAKGLLDSVMPLLDDDDSVRRGQMFGYYAQIERDKGNSAKAVELYNQALIEFEKIKLTGRIAHTIRHIADIETVQGNTKTANKNYQKALNFYRKESKSHPVDLANTLRGYAILLEGTGNMDKAKRCWTEAREIYQAAQIQEGVDECNDHLDATSGKGDAQDLL